MKLARLLCAAVFALSVGVVAASARQPSCQIKIENAPALRGFRLGMTLDEVKARVPNLIVKDTGFGAGETSFDERVFNGAPNEIFKGVRFITLIFVDKRVVRISVSYDNQIKWNNSGEFAERVGASLGLPRSWRVGEGEQAPELKCDGFTVSAYPNNISMFIPDGFDIVRQRRNDKEQKERESFVP